MNMSKSLKPALEKVALYEKWGGDDTVRRPGAPSYKAKEEPKCGN